MVIYFFIYASFVYLNSQIFFLNMLIFNSLNTLLPKPYLVYYTYNTILLHICQGVEKKILKLLPIGRCGRDNSSTINYLSRINTSGLRELHKKYQKSKQALRLHKE